MTHALGRLCSVALVASVASVLVGARATASPLSLGLEGGWNSVTGVGLMVTYRPSAKVALEAGAGLSAFGWKTGARARLVPFEWTDGGPGQLRVGPTVGAGLSHGLGSGGALLRTTSLGSDVLYRVTPAWMLQSVAGVAIGRGRLSVVVTGGYAWSLSGQNFQILDGEPRAYDLRELTATFGSGLVGSALLGWDI